MRGTNTIAGLAGVAVTFVVVSAALGDLSPAPRVDVAYDMIARIIVSGTPPPPDSFEADSERLATMPPPKYNSGAGIASTGTATGLLGGLLSAIPGVGSFLAMGASMAAGAAENAAQKRAQDENAAQSRALMSAGRITQFAYYRGWRRVSTGPFTTIDKPDQGLTLILDSTKLTYTAQRVDPDIPTYTVDATPAPVASVVGTPALTKLPPVMIDHYATRGYHLSGVIDAAQAVGWCTVGRHDVDIVEYVADIQDPENQPAAAQDPASVLAGACQPTTTASAIEPGKLVLYRSFSLQPSVAGDVTIVTELGNVRNTDVRDADLFSPPADYNEEH
jgi:hypothetical protein